MLELNTKTYDENILNLIKFFGGHEILENIDWATSFLDKNANEPISVFVQWYDCNEPVTADLFEVLYCSDFKWSHKKTYNDYGDCIQIRVDIYQISTNELICSKLIIDSNYYSFSDYFRNNATVVIVDVAFEKLNDILSSDKIHETAFFHELINNYPLVHQLKFFKSNICNAYLSSNTPSNWWSERNMFHPKLSEKVHIVTQPNNNYIYMEIYDVVLENNVEVVSKVPKYFFNVYSFNE